MTQLPPHFPDLDEYQSDKVLWFYRNYVEEFYGQYKFGHFILAAYAAIPQLLTPDLLYKLWQNYHQYVWLEETISIHRIAVTDILLSPLCREVGLELYEMDPKIREAFREWLTVLSKEVIWTKRMLRSPKEIAQFVLHYHQNPNVGEQRWGKGYQEIQQWNAYFFIHPEKVQSLLWKKMQTSILHEDEGEALRLIDFLSKKDNKHAAFLKAWKDLIQRNEKAFVEAVRDNPGFRKMLSDKPQDKHSIPISMPVEVKQRVEELFKEKEETILAAGELKERATEKNTILALLIGIDDYDANPEFRSLSGTVNDVNAIAESLQKIEHTGKKVQLTKLLNQEASRQNVMAEIGRIFQEASNETHVFLFFVGHIISKEDSSQYILSDGILTAEDVSNSLAKSSRDPYIFMILDSGRDWLESTNPKHVFISGHLSNDDLPATDGGVFGTYLADLLIRYAEQATYFDFFLELLTHFQKEVSAKRRPLFYATPKAAQRPLFQPTNLNQSIQNLLLATALKNKEIAIERLEQPANISAFGLEQTLLQYQRQKQQKDIPIFLFVFADSDGRLPEVGLEREALKSMFQSVTKGANVELIFETNPTVDRLQFLFTDPSTRNRIHLFHYAGVIERERESETVIGIGGEIERGFDLGADAFLDYFALLRWLKFQTNLRLVFLNSCKSRDMAEWMGQLGALVAIGTEGVISDAVFKERALFFYRTWLAGGLDLPTTFSNTISSSIEIPTAQEGSGPYRSITLDEGFGFRYHCLVAPWAKNLVNQTTFQKYAEDNKAGTKKRVKTFYAVLVGINEYQGSVPNLRGGINDVLAVSDYFSGICRKGDENAIINWKPLYLLAPMDDEIPVLKKRGIEHQAPTRQNIIDAFEHFTPAASDAEDICLFYYSGHSANVSAPDEFMDYDPSGRLSTIVCVDSRRPGSRDLLDVELDYLIAKTLEGKTRFGGNKKGIHFLVIIDAGHWGKHKQ